MNNYSYKSIQFAFVHPIAGAYVMSGENLNGGITITNAQEHTNQVVAPGGGVVVNFVPGDNGSIAIQTEQVSDLHAFLVNFHNVVMTAAKAGDLSNFSAGTIVVRDLNTGALHTLQGVSPNKIPDKVYGAQSQMVTWTLPAAKVVNE